MKILSSLLKFFPTDELNRLENLIRMALLEKSSHAKRIKLNYYRQSTPELLKIIDSPSKPSDGDIKNYISFLPKLSSESKIMILGSTPSFRDLFSEMGIKNYIISDFAFPMMIANLEICKKADPENEIWIKSDWRDLPISTDSLDLIIGDLVLLQFLPIEQKEFIGKIFSLLKRGGRFLVRTRTANQDLFQVDQGKIISDSLEKLPKGNKGRDIILLLWRLCDSLRNPNTQLTKPEDMIKILDNYQTQNSQEKNFLNRLRNILSRRALMDLDFPSQTREETETLFKQIFPLIDKKIASDYEDAEYFPVYNLERP